VNHPLPHNLHSLAKLFGLKPNIKVCPSIAYIVVNKDKPTINTEYEGYTVTKEAHVVDNELVVKGIKYIAFVAGDYDAGNVEAPTVSDAVREVPESFIEWVKTKKQEAILDLASLEQKLTEKRNFLNELAKHEII